MLTAFSRRWIATVLSAALIAAPLVMGAAHAHDVAAEDGVTARSHLAAAATSDSAPADAEQAVASGSSGNCEQHQSCVGQCCAACAHCVAAVLTLPSVASVAGSHRTSPPGLIPPQCSDRARRRRTRNVQARV